MVFVEVMVVGNLVVVLDVIGVCEIVCDKENGWLFVVDVMVMEFFCVLNVLICDVVLRKMFGEVVWVWVVDFDCVVILVCVLEFYCEVFVVYCCDVFCDEEYILWDCVWERIVVEV